MTEVPRNNEMPSKNLVSEHILRAERERISPTDTQLCAFFPTSIELLTDMMTTGQLLDRSDFFNLKKDHVSIIPTAGLFLKVPSLLITDGSLGLLDDPDELHEYADIEARGFAQAHAFLKRLKVPFSPQVVDRVRTYFIDSNEGHINIMNILRPGGGDYMSMHALAEMLPDIPEEKVMEASAAAQAARDRRGFIVGITSGADCIPSAPNVTAEYHYELTFGSEGVPYKAIAAIEPLGPHEKKFLRDLKERK